MKKFSFILILFSLGASQLLAQARTSFDFKVTIVSGFHKGKVFEGSFSTPEPASSGEHTLEVKQITFTCMGKTYRENDFDARPKARFVNGQFKDLYFTGGPQNQRFGLNQGFGRQQFQRASEAFVRNGESYFGYLDQNTYVEGVGLIKYNPN